MVYNHQSKWRHPQTAETRSPKTEFWTGVRDMIPLVIGAIPFGIIFGTLATSNGLSNGATLAMSACVFAGSSQFIAVGMIAVGTSVPLIVFTTFVVNVRHLLYAVSLVPYVKALPQRWKLPLSFWLTDEAYAIAIRRYQAPDPSPHKHWYYLGAALVMYFNWQLCTYVGITLGQRISDAAEWGLDFAMSVTFIGMVIPYLKTKPMWLAVAAAGGVALVAYPLPHKLGLVAASLAGIGAGIWSEQRITVTTKRDIQS
ncbi:MAG: AzlC family ABC transporter permease [Elainellaceae cyanobacterium]